MNCGIRPSLGSFKPQIIISLKFVSQAGWVDTWRFLFPSNKDFSFHVHHSYSRIDYFFIDKALLPSENVEYTAIVSDHAPLLLDLSFLLTYTDRSPARHKLIFTFKLFILHRFIEYNWCLFKTFNLSIYTLGCFYRQSIPIPLSKRKIKHITADRCHSGIRSTILHQNFTKKGWVFKLSTIYYPQMRLSSSYSMHAVLFTSMEKRLVDF